MMHRSQKATAGSSNQLSGQRVFADGQGHFLDLDRQRTYVSKLLFPCKVDFFKPFLSLSNKLLKNTPTSTPASPPRQIK